MLITHVPKELIKLVAASPNGLTLVEEHEALVAGGKFNPDDTTLDKVRACLDSLHGFDEIDKLRDCYHSGTHDWNQDSNE
jgi:hypothetical protein